MVNKGSSFADFARFFPHTYARTQQSLPPIRAANSELSQNRTKKQIMLSKTTINWLFNDI